MRYLTLNEIQTNLNLGKTVEQWLKPSFDVIEQSNILKWVEISKEDQQTFTLRLSEVYDEGDEDNLDIYGFSSVDPDDFFEETQFQSIEKTLEYIENKLDGQPDKFLNTGMCQEEYRHFLNNSIQ